MMKKILLIAIVSFFSTHIYVYAQSYQDLISQASKAYQAKNYDTSAKLYAQAFQEKEGSAGDYYHAACSWALSNQADKALGYLNLSAEKGWRNLSHLKKDQDLRSLHTLDGWQKVLLAVQANKEEYEKDFDKDLQKQLESIYVRDQMLRQMLKEVEEKFGQESEEMQYFWGLIASEDKKNEAEIEKIIEKKGWVGKSLVGAKANMTLWLVIQHAPLETQEKYLPLLKASVKMGESRGNHLALLEDRIRMRNEKPQIYGSQIRRNPETGAFYVYEILEPEYVNQRRKEVGLGPIEAYVKRWDIEWTVEQKEK